jgi:hypothetical protein
MQLQASLPIHRPQRITITPVGYGLSAFLMFVLVVSSGAIPDYVGALGVIGHDPLLRFLGYGCITGLIYRSLAESPIPRVLRMLVFIALLGGLDQILQATSRHQSGTFADWLLGMLATLSCLVLLCGSRALRNALARKNTACRSQGSPNK